MRRRYKLLLIIFISFLLVFFIYSFLRKDKFVYVSLGDDLSFNNFTTYNYTDYLKYYYEDKNIQIYKYADEYNPSDDLYKHINENIGDINYYLRNANLITISLGTVELNNYIELNEEIIVNYLNKIYILLNKVSKLNENIFLINMYDDTYEFVNRKIKEYCQNLQIKYINRADINLKYIYQNNLKTYLTYKGHKQIVDIIVNSFNNQK